MSKVLAIRKDGSTITFENMKLFTMALEFEPDMKISEYKPQPLKIKDVEIEVIQPEPLNVNIPVKDFQLKLKHLTKEQIQEFAEKSENKTIRDIAKKELKKLQ